MFVSYPFIFLNYLGPDPSPIRNRVGESESEKSLCGGFGSWNRRVSRLFSLRYFRTRFLSCLASCSVCAERVETQKSPSPSPSPSRVCFCVFVFTESTRRETQRVERIGFVIEPRLVPIR